MCGVYPIADAKSAGEQISSTYEGRHVTLREDELKHPSHTDGFVDKGDPVILCLAETEASFGVGVGVAFESAAAASDLIAVDTEGIWVQNVVATDDDGDSAVVPGDALYINTDTCVISKISSEETNIPFGYALGYVAGGADGDIAVKVHFSPMVPAILAGGKITIASWGMVIDGPYSIYMRADYSAYVNSWKVGGLEMCATSEVRMRVGGKGFSVIAGGQISTAYGILCTGTIDLRNGVLRLTEKAAPYTMPVEGVFVYNTSIDKMEIATLAGIETITSTLRVAR